jgi:hypothetical protein
MLKLCYGRNIKCLHGLESRNGAMMLLCFYSESQSFWLAADRPKLQRLGSKDDHLPEISTSDETTSLLQCGNATHISTVLDRIYSSTTSFTKNNLEVGARLEACSLIDV